MASPSTHRKGKHAAMEDELSPPVESPIAVSGKWKHAERMREASHHRGLRERQSLNWWPHHPSSFQFKRLNLPPRYIDLDDQALCSAFPQLIEILEFQGWTRFVSKYIVYYPCLVSQFFSKYKI